jgi:hypothetical protein
MPIERYIRFETGRQAMKMERITEKENLLLLLRGEQPEWVPMTMYQRGVESSRKEALHICVPPLMDGFVSGVNGSAGSIDIWGVEFVSEASAGGGYIQKPGVKLLHDITKWRDVIKAPDFSDVNWERLIGEQLKTVNRDETAISLLLNPGYFITLVGMLGFAETLLAFAEYPDEMDELLEYISDFYADIIEKVLPIYNPEAVAIGEDCVSSDKPLISLDFFRRTLLKANIKHTRMAREMGIPIAMHCCGKGDYYIDDWVENGVTMWECAFPKNDLLGVKKKYGNKLVINGGWEPTTNLSKLDADDEEIVQSVIDAIDTYAPGGGYCFNGYFLGHEDDAETLRKNNLLVKTAEDYGKKVYK